LTVHVCTPTATYAVDESDRHCAPLDASATYTFIGALSPSADAAAASAVLKRSGETARPGFEPPPSMSGYPLGPAATFADAFATLRTTVYCMFATASGVDPSHVFPAPSTDESASGSPGHSGKCSR
jgi:hypothetical protein